MTLCDTGPLYSIIDARQPHHHECDRIVASLLPLVTTLPCVTEAMYFLGRSGEWDLQKVLWEWFDSGLLSLHELSASELLRMRELMEKYSDRPMDFADASLVAIAETLNVRKIFTLDSDFRIYRTKDGGTFDIVP